MATREEALIRRYFARRGRRRRADVLLGIGDDAAVTRIGPGYDLVIATDALVEGVHFPRGTPARALGHRCLAVNLSDLAATGAEPRWATLALSLPAARDDWLRDFSRGFFALADRSGTELVGGDTVRGPLGMSVTVHGRVRPGSFARRTGALPGDGIYVTGHPGDAVAGRLGGAASLRRRFLFPEPRWREGMQLARMVSSMIDVSDGLHDDLGKLMRASGCGADGDVDALPLSRALLRYVGADAGTATAVARSHRSTACAAE